jgi:hypothetical protein
MSDHLEVSYAGISDLATRLETAATDLGTWAGVAPSLPASGAGAGAAAAVAAHLREQVPHLTRTIASASEALDATRAAYEATDERSRSLVSSLMEAM